MNDLVTINSHELQIKEYQNQRVITFKDVDVVHERAEGTAKRNFSENRGHFIEKVDYFEVSPKNVPSLEGYGFSKFAPSGILITESGYLMLVKSLTDDLAWKVQRELVNNYFKGEQLTPMDKLSPQLQAMINLELGQRRLEEEITATKEEVQAIRDAITINPKAQWRKETNRILIAIGRNICDYESPRAEVYEALKERAKCRPSILVANLQERALKNGMAPSKVNQLNILDVLENEPRLREIYVTIVKEMAVKHKISNK